MDAASRSVLISAIPPTFMKSDKNPDGVPKEVVDGIREGIANHRSQFYKDITIPFDGFNRPGTVVSEGIRENWWRQGMMGAIKAQYDCVKVLSETEFYDDLKLIDVPALAMHRSKRMHTVRAGSTNKLHTPSLLVANGQNVKVVPKLMRHAPSRSTLDVYS